jgi:hypothetical protein
VQAWLARPGCRVKLHFVPPYCPHLNSIERLWGVDASAYHPQQMLRHVQGIQHCHAAFLREEVPKNWHHYCDAVTDNFRVINPTEFRIIA